MKELNIKATYLPLGLFLQINPFTGDLMEGTLITEANMAGYSQRHEIWWNDMPEDWRRHAQALVDIAIEKVLTEESIHNGIDTRGNGNQSARSD